MRDNITAVMIVKDEERFLPQCLESLKDVMPVVLADTGSTDKTIEIARDYGAKVYEHPWQDNFSEARNWILSYIPTPWAWQQDADEELVSITESALDSLDLKYDAYQVPIHNLLPNGASGLHHFERLYQPSKVHYKWRVHNELVADGEVGVTALSIRHYGYALSEEEMQVKYERTLRLMKMEQEETGWTLRTVRHLIQSNRALQNHAKVMEIIDNQIHVLREHPGPYQEAAAGAIVAHYSLGDNVKAKIAGDKLLNEYPEALDALFYLGVCYLEDQSWGLSMDCFARYIKVRRALQLEGCDTSIIYHSWGNLSNAFNNMGICASTLGMSGQAAFAFMRAEMLAKGSADIAGYASNTDNTICRLMIVPESTETPELAPGIISLN